MSKIYITADLHLGHSANKVGFGGIIKHANRPFSCIEEHDQFIIDQWNKTVNSKDTVYILGDAFWSNHKHYIHALKAHKIMVTGSHDAMNQDTIRLFTEYHKGMLIRTINNVQFVMTHCAMWVWEGSRYNAINVHGHSHMRLPEFDDVRRMDVGVDGSSGYAPWDVDFIIYKMALKKPRQYDRGEEELDTQVTINKTRNVELYKQWIGNMEK